MATDVSAFITYGRSIIREQTPEIDTNCGKVITKVENLKAQSCITPELVFSTSLLANQQDRKCTSYKKLHGLFNELQDYYKKNQQHDDIDIEDHKEYYSKLYGIGHC